MVLTCNLTGASNSISVICAKRTRESILQQIAEINSHHTEAAKATLRTQFGLNEAYNIFLDILPIDLYL